MSVGFGATIVQLVPYAALRDDFLFGLDNGWVIDQFWIDGAPEVPLLEAWATLAAVAADTERIRIGSMVTNVANRNPGILAKSILTVDEVSDGRVDVAVVATTRSSMRRWGSTSSILLAGVTGSVRP